MKITEFVYTVECYQNGERSDFMRGWKVNAAPGHRFHAEFDTLEEANEEMRRIREEFFIREGGDYERILDDHGEDAAEAAKADFIANGSVDDDLNFYGIRKFERFCVGKECVAHILSDKTDEDFDAVCSALDRFGVEYKAHDVSEFAGDDPREDADDANYNDLGNVENANLFLEIM